MSYAPILTAPQIDRIRVFAKPRPVVAGEVLYEPDDDTPPVFVVISGEIRILAIGGGEERTVTRYSAGQFSGELLMISGRKSIYRCQVDRDWNLLELSARDLRTLIGKDAELSDIFMKAFLARRLSLRDCGLRKCSRPRFPLFRRYAGTPRVSNPRRTSLRLLRSRFDQTAQELLDRFGVASQISPS